MYRCRRSLKTRSKRVVHQTVEKIRQVIAETHQTDQPQDAESGFLDIRQINTGSGISVETFRKENSTIDFISTDSEHKKSWLANNSSECLRRLLKTNSSFANFSKTIPPFIHELNKKGHETKEFFKISEENYTKRHIEALQPGKNKLNKERREKKKNIFMVLPYSTSYGDGWAKNVKKILERFLPQNIFQAIKHNIRIVFSKTQSLEGVMKAHNAKILDSDEIAEKYIKLGCKCKDNCIFHGNCKKGGIYKIDIKDEEDKYTYTGSTNSFLRRYKEHFAKNSKSAIRTIEDVLGKDISVQTEIISLGRFGGRKCSACLREKIAIFEFKQENNKHRSLNRKSEFYATCRHTSLVQKIIDLSRKNLPPDPEKKQSQH